MTWTPWQFIVVAIAGWMNRQQQEVIEHLKEENRVLREKLGHKRIILDDAQKRRLARAANKLGRQKLRAVGSPLRSFAELPWLWRRDLAAFAEKGFVRSRAAANI